MGPQLMLAVLANSLQHAAEPGGEAVVTAAACCCCACQAVVSSEEAEAMARRLGLKFYRTCVKQDLNVTEGELGRCASCQQQGPTRQS